LFYFEITNRFRLHPLTALSPYPYHAKWRLYPNLILNLYSNTMLLGLTQIILTCVRSEVLTAEAMEIVIFWAKQRKFR
jgi:hypothetical protein